MLKVQKIEEAIAVSRDKRVLGKGDPNASGGDKTELRASKEKFFADDMRMEVEHNKKHCAPQVQ